jgi:copper resistance protein C
MPMHATRRLLGAAAAAVAVALLAVILPAQPAWAHARLVSSDPAAGAVVSQTLATVTLTFNEMVNQRFSTIVVTGSDGRGYSDGAARSVDRNLTQAIQPLPGGPVRVAWRTVSADGHPIDGEFAFTMNAPTPSTVDSPSTLAGSPATAPPLVVEPTGAPVWTAALVGVGALAGLVTAALLIRRRRRRPNPPNQP